MFVTRIKVKKQKNNRTDAAAIATEPFWVPFIESPPTRSPSLLWEAAIAPPTGW